MIFTSWLIVVSAFFLTDPTKNKVSSVRSSPAVSQSPNPGSLNSGGQGGHRRDGASNSGYNNRDPSLNNKNNRHGGQRAHAGVGSGAMGGSGGYRGGRGSSAGNNQQQVSKFFDSFGSLVPFHLCLSTFLSYMYSIPSGRAHTLIVDDLLSGLGQKLFWNHVALCGSSSFNVSFSF